MNKEYLIECIENEIESSNFDFKKDIYDFTITQNKQDFLKDVLSFANSHSNGDKFIITGVKLYPDGHRDLVGITESKIKDGADYQSLINDNIEPSIIIDFDVIEYQDNKYGIFCIKQENDDRPYLLSKKYEKLEKGFIKIRKGQKNEFVTRRDFDIFYKSKFSNETSDIYLRGIEHKKVLNKYCVQKYDEYIDFESMKNKIYDKFVEIYNFKVIESSSSFKMGNKVEFRQDEIKSIKEYAINNDMPIDKDFFNLGNLYYMSVVGGSGTLMGSNSEKEKYELIEELEEYTGIYNGLYKFYNELNNYYYLELAIENLGKKFDEDIEINLKIKKEEFIEFKNFPVPSEKIIKRFLDEKIIDKLIKIDSINGISNYTSTNMNVSPLAPKTFKIPGMLSYVEPDYEGYVNYYIEYIQWLTDFEITCDEEYYYVKCEQKHVKPNEKILLPARLIFKEIPKSIKYEIKTKHNSKIMKGQIKADEN